MAKEEERKEKEWNGKESNKSLKRWKKDRKSRHPRWERGKIRREKSNEGNDRRGEDEIG